MEIDGLTAHVKVRHPDSVLTHFRPVTGGPRFLALETHRNGQAVIELQDDGDLPNEGPAERICINFDHDDAMIERMLRAMAVFHFGLHEAETNLTFIDTEMLARGFELGFEEGGKPVWIRVHSAMNVVLRNSAEDGLPSRKEEQISLLCIIPGRNQVRYICENLSTAFKVLEKNRPFTAAVVGDESEMLTQIVVDAESVVYH
jgi:hypothetical protein